MTRWAEKNHKIIIGIMSLILMVFIGMYIKDLNIGSRVQANERGIIANKTEIGYVKETHVDKFERIEVTLEKQDIKLDDISTAITAIQTILEK